MLVAAHDRTDVRPPKLLSNFNKLRKAQSFKLWAFSFSIFQSSIFAISCWFGVFHSASIADKGDHFFTGIAQAHQPNTALSLSLLVWEVVPDVAQLKL